MAYGENDQKDSDNKQNNKEQTILDQLRSETKKAYFNQKLIEKNRIWPN